MYQCDPYIAYHGIDLEVFGVVRSQSTVGELMCFNGGIPEVPEQALDLKQKQVCL